MKRFLLIALAGSLLVACANSSQDKKAASGDSTTAATTAATDSANYTTLQWLDSTHQDLPKVKEGQVVEVQWRFRNTGDKPLVITNASASCGCTVAEKPEQPIAPGGEGAIKAKFDSKGREGEQRKTVYVGANTKGTEMHELSFALEVEKK
ncbi:DUF1573 domain-containing protein [Paraflavisolibacter sp. H34]|uniref:DUF1573 domain-containing protein n=1 Tax=Huijunlia imazamoxiresistens TaxID=3127457 RepID=UPI00301A3082